MTRDMRPAVLCTFFRAASLLIGALVVASLSGCADVASIVGETADASLTQKAKPTIALSPAAGLPQPFEAKVNEQFAAAAKAKGVQLADERSAEYVVKPSFTAGIDGKKGTKVTYAIDVTDKSGAPYRHFEGEEHVSNKRGSDGWAHVSEEAIMRVAQRSVADFSAFMDNPQAAPPAVAAATPQQAQSAKKLAKAAPAKPKAAQPAIAAAVVTPDVPKKEPNKGGGAELVSLMPVVTAAPGDGKTSLANAMKRALTQQGIKVASKSNNAYKVQGHVELGAAENGAQAVTIRWMVFDPAGKQLEKTVIQKNKIEQGRLDQAWGDIADQAAGAAAIEISKLMSSASSSNQAQQGPGGSAG